MDPFFFSASLSLLEIHNGVVSLLEDTLDKTEIIYPKNVGASVAMNFT